MKLKDFLLEHFFSLLISGFIILTFYHLYLTVKDKNEFENGYNDFATIVEQPSSAQAISTKISFIKLLYNGELYTEKIGPGFSKNIGKSKLEVRINKDQNKLFLLNEDFDGEIGTSILIIIILSFCFYKIY